MRERDVYRQGEQTRERNKSGNKESRGYKGQGDLHHKSSDKILIEHEILKEQIQIVEVIQNVFINKNKN